MNTHEQNLPDYVDAVYREAKIVAGQMQPLTGFGEDDDAVRPILVCVVRNEMGLLPDFLAHYRRLGIKKFVFVDNASTDATPDFLDAQRDVKRIRIDRTFSWQNKQGWITQAMKTIGEDRWYLVVDADEFLAYDRDPDFSITSLVIQLELMGLRRARGVLIDLYPAGPIQDDNRQLSPLNRNGDWCFDNAPLRESNTDHLVSRKGGPRQRAFSAQIKDFDPELTKYPLFRLKWREIMANPHHLYPYQENFDSPCLLGLLHFKFTADLMKKVENAVNQGQYWDESAEYKAYLKALQVNPELSLMDECSQPYTGAADLLRAEQINGINWRFEQWRRRWRRVRLFFLRR